jgi:hypothetical protein
MVVAGLDRTVYLNATVIPRVWNKSILQTGSLHRKRLLEKVGKFQEEVESNDLKSQDIRQSLNKFQAVKSK